MSKIPAINSLDDLLGAMNTGLHLVDSFGDASMILATHRSKFAKNCQFATVRRKLAMTAVTKGYVVKVKPTGLADDGNHYDISATGKAAIGIEDTAPREPRFPEKAAAKKAGKKSPGKKWGKKAGKKHGGKKAAKKAPPQTN